MRQVVESFGSPSQVARLVGTNADDQRDLAHQHHEVLLQRVHRLVESLTDVPPGDTAGLVAMRVVLADLALVAASFRQRTVDVGRLLEVETQRLGEARHAANVYERPSERTSGS